MYYIYIYNVFVKLQMHTVSSLRVEVETYFPDPPSTLSGKLPQLGVSPVSWDQLGSSPRDNSGYLVPDIQIKKHGLNMAKPSQENPWWWERHHLAPWIQWVLWCTMSLGPKQHSDNLTPWDRHLQKLNPSAQVPIKISMIFALWKGMVFQQT